MQRVSIIVLVAILLGSSITANAPRTLAEGRRSPSKSTKGKVDPSALREMLTKGLKATRDDQKDYINHIVSLVAEDKLPVALVYASFRYARTRRPRYPFPYFVFSVQTLAKNNKIEL